MKDWLPILTAGLGFITALIGWRIVVILKQVKVEINGRFSELLRLTAKSSKAEGALEEKEKDNAGSN